MHTFLTAFHPRGDETNALSDECKTWLTNSKTEKLFIFQADSKDYASFFEETEACLGEGCDIVKVVLKPLTTNFETPNEIQELAWANLNTITSYMDANTPKTVFLGRGSGLHEHLMWIAAKCRNGTNIAHFDEIDGTFDAASAPVIDENKKGFITLAALLEDHVEDIIHSRFEDAGWSHAHRLGGRPGGPIESGVRKALGPAIEKGLVELLDVDKGKTVAYKLTPNGIESAVLAYFRERQISDQPQREVLISFARLPIIQNTNEERKVKPFSFFNLIAPLQPVDGLICILQRHDDSIEGTHILTLDRACEEFKNSHFIGDLMHARQSLEHRCSEDSIRTAEHLVVINPRLGRLNKLEFIAELLAILNQYETKHGPHRINIDITSPLKEIRTAVSMVGLNSHSRMVYTVKPIVDGRTPGSTTDSKHAKRHHCINLPGMEAFNAFQKATNVNKNNQYDVEMLKIILNNTRQLTNDDSDDFDFFGEVATDIEPPTLPELVGMSKGTIPKEQGNRVINRLRSRGLVAVILLQDKAKTRYELTDIGFFVASQLVHLENGVENL